MISAYSLSFKVEELYCKLNYHDQKIQVNWPHCNIGPKIYKNTTKILIREIDIMFITHRNLKYTKLVQVRNFLLLF